MFGVTQREHDARYDFAQEWLDAVKRAWAEPDDFDFDGQFLKLKGVRAYPKPYGGTRPIIMNAGSSDVGQAFALRNCDAFFVATAGSRTSLEGNAKKVTEIKRAAQNVGREIEVYTVGQVICRPTPEGGGGLLPPRHHRERRLGRDRRHARATRTSRRKTIPPEEYAKKRQYFAANAIGGYPFVGTPDRVAEELAKHQQGRRARHRAVVRQLSRRVAVLPRRGAAAPGSARVRAAGCRPAIFPDTIAVARSFHRLDAAMADRHRHHQKTIIKRRSLLDKDNGQGQRSCHRQELSVRGWRSSVRGSVADAQDRIWSVTRSRC